MTVTRMDAKGRISLPAHTRSSMGVKSGDSVILVTNDRKEIAVTPSVEGHVVTVRAVFRNLHIGMKRITSIFSSHDARLVSLESFTLERGEKFGCVASVEMDSTKIDGMKRKIKNACAGDVEFE